MELQRLGRAASCLRLAEGAPETVPFDSVTGGGKCARTTAISMLMQAFSISASATKSARPPAEPLALFQGIAEQAAHRPLKQFGDHTTCNPHGSRRGRPFDVDFDHAANDSFSQA